MRCISCGEDIPPKWVAVIERNVCPSCDGPIMTSDAIQLKTELAEALAKMPNDPQGVTGWLLSNYKVQKIGSAEPVERFNRPGGTGPANNHVPDPNFKHASNPYQELLERTHMAGRVNSAQAVALSNKDKIAAMRANMGNLPDPHDPVMSDDVASQEDYETARELMEQGIDPFNPSNNRPGSSGGALTPQQIMNIQKQASRSADQGDLTGSGARSNVGYNNDDTLTDAELDLIRMTGDAGKEVIHNQRARRIKAQDAITSGELSHPQGFTRSG